MSFNEEGFEMQKQWVEKNVDLALLSKCFENFLEGKGCETERDMLSNGYEILGTPKRIRGLGGGIIVRILGDCNDFVVELMASQRTHNSIMWGYLATFFGGGSFFLRGMKSKEALERLESEFWIFAEEKVKNLVDSARC